MMKNLLLSLILVPCLFACNQGGKDTVDLTGNVKNLPAGFFVLGGPGGAKDTITLEADGSFLHTLTELSKPSSYYLMIMNEYMPFKVAPGMKLDISFDASAFKRTLQFSGKGSDINNYLVAKSVRGGDISYDAYKLDAGVFRAKQDSMLGVYKTILAEAPKDDPNDPFWKTEEAEILFTWANNLAVYEPYHAYFADMKDYKVPEDFYSYQDKLDINQAAYAGSPAFKGYVSTFVRKSTDEKIAALKAADSTRVINSSKISMETALELISDQQVLDNYLFDNLSGQISWKDIDGEMQESIDLFLGKCRDTSLVNQMNTLLAEWKRLGKGQPAFEFTGKDLEGKTVKLSDFRGKLVYVDVWATWCSPCKYEIPYLDTLETDYHGKNIVFISYSIDEDYQAWKKFVPENNLKGVQIIGEKAWESQLVKQYKIMGVPTFMLFDTDGNIVTVKMTRPSDKKTRETIDGLL
jgi:thiol-disulfide isomerase/thioredoxin